MVRWRRNPGWNKVRWCRRRARWRWCPAVRAAMEGLKCLPPNRPRRPATHFLPSLRACSCASGSAPCLSCSSPSSPASCPGACCVGPACCLAIRSCADVWQWQIGCTAFVPTGALTFQRCDQGAASDPPPCDAGLAPSSACLGRCPSGPPPWPFRSRCGCGCGSRRRASAAGCAGSAWQPWSSPLGSVVGSVEQVVDGRSTFDLLSGA